MKSLENSKVDCWVGAKGVVVLVFLDEDLHNHQCYYWKWVDEEKIPNHDGSKQQDSCSLLGFPRFTVQAFLLSDSQPFCMDNKIIFYVVTTIQQCKPWYVTMMPSKGRLCKLASLIEGFIIFSYINITLHECAYLFITNHRKHLTNVAAYH